MRDIIRCGLAMIVCFAALAGLYVIAGAPVVAAAQVLVYIGAISVLVLFAIMLTQTKAAPARSCSRPRRCRRPSLSVILALLIAVVVASTDWPVSEARVWTDTAEASPADLFAGYTLPFEVVSVLLLAAVIGGVFLAKRERGDAD